MYIDEVNIFYDQALLGAQSRGGGVPYPYMDI